MARILINAQTATLGQSATGRYVRALVRWLPSTCPQHRFTYFDYLWRTRSYLWSLPTRQRLLWPMPPRVGEMLFRRFPLSRLATGRHDLLHLPDDTSLRTRRRRTVSTLHMSGPLQRPDLYPAPYVEHVRTWVRRVRDTQDALITVSEHLRELVIAEFAMDPSRVHSIPLGVDEEFRPQPASGTNPPTILYVGWIRQAKNVPGVCQTFLRLASEFPDLRLLLVGKREVPLDVLHAWLGNDKDVIRRTELLGPVRLSSTELARLYSSASVLLFPSFAEGWTSPPLEAMACGLPVVCSNVSSLPETVGDAALMASPEDYDGLAGEVRRLLLDHQLRDEMRQRGFRRAEQFSWEKMARTTGRLYSALTS